jgi:hypothetical protein
MPTPRFRPAAAACLLALCVVVSLPAAAGGSNKWRLEFSGAAESAGELVFEIVPTGEAPVRVMVPIERNDGEDVLVKRRFFRRFSIALVSSTVKDVRIGFDRE